MDLRGREVFGGLDLSETQDLTAQLRRDHVFRVAGVAGTAILQWFGVVPELAVRFV
jgi:hypothetical protein